MNAKPSFFTIGNADMKPTKDADDKAIDAICDDVVSARLRRKFDRFFVLSLSRNHFF